SLMPLTAASCRRIAVTGAVALHGCALAGLLTLRPAAPPQPSEPEPILVQWIAPVQAEPSRPEPVAPPQPLPLPEPPPKAEPIKPAPKPEPPPKPKPPERPIAQPKPKLQPQPPE